MFEGNFVYGIKLLIIKLILLIFVSATWAETYYIDGTKGDDESKEPTEISSPWKTIGKANSTLQAGDTVYLRAGTYKIGIVPVNSGKSGNYITYKNYNDEEVILTGMKNGANLDNKSYIIVDGFKIFDTTDEWVSLSSGSYNIIKNCHMEVSGNYVGIRLESLASYNKILNNTLIGYCTPADLIQFRYARYNLIEGNKLYYSNHTAIGSHGDGCQYNIIRYNYIQNKWHHGISFEGSKYILVENNIVVDSGDDKENNLCGTQWDRDMARNEQKGINTGLSRSIIRNNVMINTGYSLAIHTADIIPQAEENIMYNNTCNANYYGIKVPSAGDYSVTDYAIKNNIFSNSVDYNIYIPVTNQANYYINNNIYNGKEKWNSSGDIKIDNVSTDPFFIDEDGKQETSIMRFPGRFPGSSLQTTNSFQATNSFEFKQYPISVGVDRRDLRLQSSSPMIDKGAFLAQTINECSGGCNEIQVDDARYFMDGWGIIDGDVIQLEELKDGNPQTAMIVKVDYNSNTITVDAHLFWSKGKGVSLPYKGSAPDIGAYESEDKRESRVFKTPTGLQQVFKDSNLNNS